jgi:hypothetical protein
MFETIFSFFTSIFSGRGSITDRLEKQFAVAQKSYTDLIESLEKRIVSLEERLKEMEKSACYRINCVSRTNEYTVNKKNNKTEKV